MARRRHAICSVVAPVVIFPALAAAQEQSHQSLLIAPHLHSRATVERGDAALAIDRHIAEASARFALPEHWIRAVIAAESAGDPHAVSSAGAMGLMQIMPTTWADLRVAYGLGDDPFEPRDNILGGTAYLRELYDRFGSRGFLAAYNAGPARYAEHLATGRPLPRETRAYVARLAPVINGSQTAELPPADKSTPRDWRETANFLGQTSVLLLQPDMRPQHHSEHAVPDSNTRSATLFVPASSVRAP